MILKHSCYVFVAEGVAIKLGAISYYCIIVIITVKSSSQRRLKYLRDHCFLLFEGGCSLMPYHYLKEKREMIKNNEAKKAILTILTSRATVIKFGSCLIA